MNKEQIEDADHLSPNIRVCDYVRWQLACNNFLQYHVNLQQGYTDFSDVYQVLNMLRHIFDETMP